MIRGIFWGLVVTWIGLWIWLGNLYPETFAFRYAWPLIFIIIGVAIILRLIHRAAKSRRYGTRIGGIGTSIFWSLMFMAVGLVIWFSNINLFVPSFGQLWPFIIVAVGLAIIVQVIVHYSSRRPRKVTIIINKLEDGKINVDEAVEEIRKTRGGREGHFGVTVDVNPEKDKPKKDRG